MWERLEAASRWYRSRSERKTPSASAPTSCRCGIDLTGSPALPPGTYAGTLNLVAITQ